MITLPLYPMRFQPILKDYLWGGSNLSKLFPEKIDPTLQCIAESWEIADLEENVSIVSNGSLEGRSLRELLKEHGEEILGVDLFKKTGGSFPLLIKLIDAQKQLSLQVHPDDAYAKKHEKGLRGKTEMWYLIKAMPSSSLVCGFKPKVTLKQFQKVLERDQFEEQLQIYSTREGDVFFIPPGTIHAIDKGNILFEIQTTSDLTYRIYDWGRVDSNGKRRPTHRKKAEAVLKFENPLAGKREPKFLEEDDNLKKEDLLSCSEFSVQKWDFSSPLIDSHLEPKCLIYCFIQGNGFFELPEGDKIPFSAGQTFLIPAALESIQIHPSSQTSFLRVYP